MPIFLVGDQVTVKVLSQSQATSVLVVAKQPAPIEPPPPPGTVWERIERARLSLGWSAREFARRAHLKSETHYGLIGTQSKWNADERTRDALITALIQHGVDPKQLEGPSLIVVDANAALGLLRKHASALLQLPPYDYSPTRAQELVAKVLAFKHDTELEAQEVAALADHIERTLHGLPPRPPLPVGRTSPPPPRAGRSKAEP